jgi:hypothetical protein
MKALAASIVVFSGCFLWAVGSYCLNLAYSGPGNRHPGELATWGGIIVTTIGLALVMIAIRAGRDRLE